MCSSPRNPSERDSADWGATVAGWSVVLALGGALAGWGAKCEREMASGAVEIFPEMQVRIAPAPMPDIPVPPPEPAPVPEPVPDVIPEPEPDLEPLPEPVFEREEIAPELEPPPPEAAPAEAAQPVAEPEGDAGEEEAIRSEWLGELRRRIEQSKFYPGAARYSKETGTVLLRVEIGPAAEIGPAQILENTGSALLAEGARSILRRAAAKPLGTNALPEGFQVEVPITYRLERR